MRASGGAEGSASDEAHAARGGSRAPASGRRTSGDEPARETGQRRCWRRRWPARPLARRSPSAQARRQPVAEGPVSDGVSPRPARRRAEYQSVRASSPSSATARSMRSPRRRASSPSAGQSGAPNVTMVRPGLGRFMPLPRIEPVPSRWTGITGRAGAHGQERRAAPERLAPAVGRPAALGEDEQAPALLQRATGPGRPSAGSPGSGRSGTRRGPGPTPCRDPVEKK